MSRKEISLEAGLRLIQEKDETDDDFYRRARNGAGTANSLRSAIMKQNWKPGDKPHWHYERHPKHGTMIRLTGVFMSATTLAYLCYRAVFTIGYYDNTSAGLIVFQVLFWCCEAAVFFCTMENLLIQWKLKTRDCVDFKKIPIELLETKHFNEKAIPSDPNFVDLETKHMPSVAVMLPCYKEPLEVVMGGVSKAAEMDYPGHLLDVYLCDDGRDPKKQQYVEELRIKKPNVHYLIRSDNNFAKAGNLNAAFNTVKSDLIVILDCDFHARPKFLQRMVPYFYNYDSDSGKYVFDQKLAFVQGSQGFRNMAPDEDDYTMQRNTTFFEMIQPGCDNLGMVPMVGTCFIMSRSACEEVDRFPTGLITEDTAMTINFFSKGYKSYCGPEYLAFGLSCTTLWSQLTQHARWTKGDYQLLLSRATNPLLAPNLKPMHRMILFRLPYGRMLEFFNAYMYIALPLFLIGGYVVMQVPSIPMFFGLFYGNLIVSAIYTYTLMSINPTVFRMGSTGIYFMSAFMYFPMKHLFIALIKGNKLKFKVTKKDAGDGDTEKNKQDLLEDRSTRTMIVLDEDKEEDSDDEEFNETRSAMSEMVEGVPQTGDDKRKNFRRVWTSYIVIAAMVTSLVWGGVSPPNVQLGETGDQTSNDKLIFIFTYACGIVISINTLVIFFCAGKTYYISPYERQNLETVEGYDPGWSFDENGKAYVAYSWAQFPQTLNQLAILGAILYSFVLVVVN
eukprot:Nk52_evm50s226 gene=Nk52_evmTU50s226